MMPHNAAVPSGYIGFGCYVHSVRSPYILLNSIQTKRLPSRIFVPGPLRHHLGLATPLELGCPRTVHVRFLFFLYFAHVFSLLLLFRRPERFNNQIVGIEFQVRIARFSPNLPTMCAARKNATTVATISTISSPRLASRFPHPPRFHLLFR
ncbi:uncharacterized protein EI90DRAFT_349561 [Cantharellus anzutake]|uniref:uncharacterized protein n=1 Tax=Cantharellus anzutake TaxID=1750568 RepID=UPI001904B948|nr:uncharacterized protein EI90DRAFT_349561 [Cantharellus anzutake]KAF8315270.1 hypothetical protein EI90DRAFT_349561 [Cantharellus anzutake]